MELAKYNLKQKRIKNWINIRNQSKDPNTNSESNSSELYEKEKKLMFTGINNLMTQLIIDRDRSKV